MSLNFAILHQVSKAFPRIFILLAYYIVVKGEESKSSFGGRNDGKTNRRGRRERRGWGEFGRSNSVSPVSLFLFQGEKILSGSDKVRLVESRL